MLAMPTIPMSHVHPILVNFTAGLVPVSLASDLLGRWTGRRSLLHTGWWSVLYATLITPLTVLAGLLWKHSVEEFVPRETMALHQWLGTVLVGALLMLAYWRGRIHRRGDAPDIWYLVAAFMVVAALVAQGSIGGRLAFGP